MVRVACIMAGVELESIMVCEAMLFHLFIFSSSSSTVETIVIILMEFGWIFTDISESCERRCRMNYYGSFYAHLLLGPSLERTFGYSPSNSTTE